MAKKEVVLDLNNLPDSIKDSDEFKAFLAEQEEAQAQAKKEKVFADKKTAAIKAVNELSDDVMKAYQKTFIIRLLKKATL